MIDAAQAVLSFWFDELPPEKQFVRDDAVDAEIGARFGELHAQLSSACPQAWQADPQSLLAAIFVLDQFSRNLFRDDPRAFANDAAALALTKMAVDLRWDADLSPERRAFLYMPLMHSEHLPDVERCEDLMAASGLTDNAAFAARHADTIRRYGRYPARNEALGRETTEAEAALLRENPAGF